MMFYRIAIYRGKTLQNKLSTCMRFVLLAPNGTEEEQRKGIKEYFSYRGIFGGDCSTILPDYEYNDSKYDTGIKEMLSQLSEGDVLYVWDLSSLAKSIRNLYTNLLFACNKGVSIVQCLDGEVLGNDTSESNAIVRGIGIASRIEFSAKQNISRATAAKRKRLIEEKGGYFTKSGRWKTYIGRAKGADMSNAHRAAHIAVKNRAQEWRDNSVGYRWVIEQVKAGVDRKDIIEEFNRRHETNPSDFSTRNGRPICAGVLSKWISDIGLDKTT